MVNVEDLVERARADGLSEIDCLILRDLIVNGFGHPGPLSPVELRGSLGAGWAVEILLPDLRVTENIASQIFAALFADA